MSENIQNPVIRARYDDKIEQKVGNELRDTYQRLFDNEDGLTVLKDIITYAGYPQLNWTANEAINSYASGLNAIINHIIDRLEQEETNPEKQDGE